MVIFLVPQYKIGVDILSNSNIDFLTHERRAKIIEKTKWKLLKSPPHPSETVKSKTILLLGEIVEISTIFKDLKHAGLVVSIISLCKCLVWRLKYKVDNITNLTK